MDKRENRKVEIIVTAFKEWGGNHFVNTSLTAIALKLKISKPALFRYFKSKEDLLANMRSYFLEEFYPVLDDITENIAKLSFKESVEYYSYKIFTFFMNNLSYFKYFSSPITSSSFASDEKILGYQKRFTDAMINKLDGSTYIDRDDMKMFLGYVFSTGLYIIFSQYHCSLSGNSKTRQNLDAEKTISKINEILLYGFYDDRREARLNFENIERGAIISENEIPQRDKIFTAITDVVAEVGLLDASMDKIAHRAGMTKSSLYFHFKNREDMFKNLLENELGIMQNILINRMNKYDSFEEKLYSFMATFHSYLTMDLRILRYFNWIQFQRLKYKIIKKSYKKIEDIINNINNFLIKAINDNTIKTYDLEGKDIASLINIQIIRDIVMKLALNGIIRPDEKKDMRLIYRLFLNGYYKGDRYE
ncbi:MAG TPA: TetR/AcrR family transcriptional regulator [Spirochaetota bacterium]|nr:TetR/AcrR family transcriptional regulator [Spirochaetota bacterium]